LEGNINMEIWQQLVDVNDTRLYCERAGTGDPLVLVHGGGGDRRYWDGQFEKLAETHDVVRYDLRGYGKSDNPVEGQAYRHEDDLHGLLMALGISRADIAGFSLGCQVVVDTYTVHPHLFRSIIAVGPFTSGHTSPATDALFGAYVECGEIFGRDGARAAAEGFVGIPAFNPAHIHSQAKTKILNICSDYSWWWASHADPMESVQPTAAALLKNIQVPLLTVTAEYDAAACREVADLLEQQVALNSRVDIAGATHFVLMEKPADFNRALTQFISEVAQ
jgi:pimeloyl-ACP methyl ester carboxylesterase